MKEKMIEYLKKTEKPYKLKVGDINAEIAYSKTNKQFNECMLNIIK